MPRRRQKSARSCAESIASECVGARVRMLSRAMTRMYDEALRPYGIRFAQMNILTMVTLGGPVQPSVVAEQLSIEKSTLSRNVKMLESRGWLESIPGESGNTQLLRATPAGEALLVAATPAWRSVQDRILAQIGGPAARAIQRATDRV